MALRDYFRENVLWSTRVSGSIIFLPHAYMIIYKWTGVNILFLNQIKVVGHTGVYVGIFLSC